MARGAKPGERRGGRKKGTPNKVTNETAAQIMARYNVSGIEGLCMIAAGMPLKCNTFTNKETGEFVVLEVEPTFDQRMTAYKELAQYEAPKLKAVEHSGPEGGEIPHGLRIQLVKADDAK